MGRVNTPKRILDNPTHWEKKGRHWCMTIEGINANKPERSILTAIKVVGDVVQPSGSRHDLIYCECACGGNRVTRKIHLMTGDALSCGCMMGTEEYSYRKKKYKNNVKAISAAYYDMMNRCYLKSLKSYAGYGGRGVVVCEEWKNDYGSFLNWSLVNG